MPHTVHAISHHEATAEGTSPDAVTLAAFAAVALLGGGNAVAIKFGLLELAPYWAAALRFLGASAVLLCVIGVQRRPLPRGRALAGVLLFGSLATGLSFAFAYFALTQVTAGTAQVALALAPLFTAIFAIAHGIEKFRAQRFVGAGVAVIGVSLVFYDSIGTASPLALAALLAAAACLAEASVVAKRFPRVNPLVENAIGMGTGGLILLLLSAIFGEAWAVPAASSSWASLGYLVVFGSIGVFGMYLFVIGRWTASGASFVLLVIPLFTVVAGYLLLGETISPAFALGAVIIVGGVWLGAFAPHWRPPPKTTGDG